MDNDTEFLTVAEAEMQSLEAWLEAASEDIDGMRGNVLTIELENGEQSRRQYSKPTMRFWCASRFGVYYFSLQEGAWKDSRSG